MPVHDELGSRLKHNYEEVAKYRLTRRMPVAIRLDGKAFHTLTRGFRKPFDEVLVKSMQQTMKYLCENTQGVVVGYSQSDEITLILIDYQKLTSDAWFDYEVQKMCSISASMATMAFNRFFKANIDEYRFAIGYDEKGFLQKEQYDQWLTYEKAYDKGAMFDARCFNVPKEEVTNLVYWRQVDAGRNSIQMVGQANFSHKELEHKTCNMIQDMLMTQKGINWNDFPTHLKRGSCCIRNKEGKWVIDIEIPLFKNEGREYIDKLIQVGEQ